MPSEQDPVQRAAGEDADLYDIATWEPRTGLDRASAWLYGALGTGAKALVVALAALIVVAQFAAATGLLLVDRPVIGVYVLLSVAPALAVAGYIWRSDATRREPLELLVVTFALGFLFAGFAAVLNSAFSGLFFGVAEASPGWVAVVAPALFYFVVVGPVEETVKWLAIRLYAFRDDRFDAVVDGAVYGAMAGLGFATIENAIYVLREVVAVTQTAGGQQATEVAFQVAAVRTFAGPGHVIYSAFAGYYLGLAKFNPDDAGPIVVKGLVVAALIHATYNTAVTNLGAVAEFVGLGQGVAFLAFVVVYDGLFFYVLYRKLSAYRLAYVDSGAQAAEQESAATAEGPDREREAADSAGESADYREESGATESGEESES
ncbi:PrsW family intramembrane metalloprotease [Halobacterium jilantaiense]|uniref:Membrane proteinase PrsW, cleaves anti-sigma factor RsiW, M82 family n=1 Tax=Halobacterium jilantaiense TaxID=355548 RepID=A0A1I0PBD8_9EURY|nr:PrsW family intramembrane metalloprotease [Halobacterium jilantaiense]SEW11690.1 Membrane proteinase PrsW, cleaves anti-sigma factor RsiW, M82 family [Halobacterium jilantaiense]